MAWARRARTHTTHQQKKLNEEELIDFRNRFSIPLSDKDVRECPFYKPTDDSDEVVYLKERRTALGGFVPARSVKPPSLKVPSLDLFKDSLQGSGDGEFSTTMVFVGLLKKLLQNKEIGKLIVPIIPDEARTFGMDAFFKPFGIYSNHGQLYEPVDSKTLLAYREAKDGQVLEEGINEAGAMSSWIAAGTSQATHGIPTIRSTSITRCSATSASATSSGPPPICRRDFSLGGTAGERRFRVKARSTRRP